MKADMLPLLELRDLRKTYQCPRLHEATLDASPRSAYPRWKNSARTPC